MNEKFFLVSPTTKLFLSSRLDGFNGPTDVIFHSRVLEDILWYENEDGYLGVHGTDLMLVDDEQPSLILKENFENAQGKPKLEKHDTQLYVVHGAHFIVENQQENSIAQGGPFNNRAVFRKVYPHQFLGCVHWSGAAYHTTDNPNFVQEGLQQIEQLGFGIAKVKLNKPRENYRGRVPNHKPTSIVSTIDNVFYESLLPFHTIILSVWSTNEWSHDNREDKDDAYVLHIEGDELEAQIKEEYIFFYELTQYLQNKFENKTIVLQNRKSEDIIAGDQAEIDKVIRWMRARQRGVSDGRSTPPVPNSTKVLHAIEFNRLGRCDKILPFIEVDLVSYAIYENNVDLSTTLDYINVWMSTPSRYMRQIGHIDERFSQRVYLGEYGTWENGWEKGIVRDAISWGCPFVLYWQIFEDTWRYEDGTNPGRGLYLPNDPEDVAEFPEPQIPVTVKKTKTAEWFRSLLVPSSSIVACKHKEMVACGETAGCQYNNLECIADIPHTIQNQYKGYRNEVARTFRNLLGPERVEENQTKGYKHKEYQQLYNGYDDEARINKKNRNAWLGIQLEKNIGGKEHWEHDASNKIRGFLMTAPCIVCADTTGEQFHKMRCCGHPIHESCLTEWHDSHAQDSAYLMHSVFANVYGDGSNRPRVNRFCVVKCLNCHQNLDNFRQPPIIP